MLVLSVEVGEDGADFAEPALRHQRTVDESPRPAAADLPPQDELAILGSGAELVEQAGGCRRLVELEKALDDTAFGSRTHRLGRHRGTQNRLERTDQDRLAGAGLTGDDVEARAELDVGALDQGEVLDVESGEHDSLPFHAG